MVINDYTDQSDTKIPLDVQAGTSFKPAHMPVRFSFTLYNLTDWKEVQGEADTGIENPTGLDQFFRHSILGLEFLITKNVELLFGYDHKKRKELKLPETSGNSGFSYGILIGVKAFKFGFGRNGYQTGGVSNTFTLTTNLGRWIKRKSVSE